MVESSGLLNRRRVKNSTGGSNPPLSASFRTNYLQPNRGSVGQYRTIQRSRVPLDRPATELESLSASGSPFGDELERRIGLFVTPVASCPQTLDIRARNAHAA